MPIYEYRCTSCEEVFEVMQRVGDRRKRTCESCGGKLEKLVSRTSFQLKGGGWFDQGYGGGPSAGTEPGKKGAAATGTAGKKTKTKKKSGKNGAS